MKDKIVNSYKTIASILNRSFSKRPLISFLGFLGLLLAVMFAGSFLRQPEITEEAANDAAKPVRVFSVGSTPTYETTAKVEKSGVVTIVAQTAGIVGNVNVEPGTKVSRGRTIVSLQSTYSGGNAPAIQSEIATKQLQLVEDTYDENIEAIKQQRELAELAEENSEELRKITEDSINRTREQLTLNNDILSSISTSLTTLENTTPRDEALILSTKQLKGQYLSIVAGLEQSLRGSEYQSDNDEPVNKIADVTRDLTLKQLEVQEQSLSINKEIAELSSKLARVNASLMYPAAPYNGTIERVFVEVGQAVNPGQKIATITGNAQTATGVALVSKSIAESVNPLEKISMNVNGVSYEANITYVSTEPTDGQNYSISFYLPEEACDASHDREYISVSFSVGQTGTSASAPLIPLDAVFQTSDTSTVFVEKEGSAESVSVRLGEVVGNSVRILEGLEDDSQIILDRSVISGEAVSIQ